MRAALLQLLTAAFGTSRPIPPYAICVRFRGVADIDRHAGSAARVAIAQTSAPCPYQSTRLNR
jgi:hypothetical protein